MFFLIIIVIPKLEGEYKQKNSNVWEYVETHKKHNVNFLAFFSVVASRQISPHFPVAKIMLFREYPKTAQIVFSP